MPNGEPSKAFLNRYYAYVLARMTYRDTDLLEDRHTSSPQLNMEFYKEMLSEVQLNYENISPKIKALIEGSPAQTEDEKSLSVWMYGLLQGMNDWLPPKKVRDKFNESIAEFVLKGEFLSACTQ